MMIVCNSNRIEIRDHCMHALHYSASYPTLPIVTIMGHKKGLNKNTVNKSEK